MTTTSTFDVGPLSWVKGEIDLALDRASQALQQYGQAPTDTTQLKFCRTHLHQVRGALAIVGLDGVTQFTDALEALLGDIENGKQPGDTARIGLIGRAVATIRRYLEDLLAGDPNQPLRLLDVYRQLATARGLPAPAASELFFPDVSLRPQLPAVSATGDPATQLKNARTRYQKGLLNWLKTPDKPIGAIELKLAAQLAGTADQSPALRGLWWAVGAFFSALAERAIKLDPEVKALCSKIDQQIRQQQEGSRAVPERLIREVLYQVATARTQNADVVAVRKAWQLADLIPSADGQAVSAAAQIEPFLKRLKEIGNTAEEGWNKFCGGNVQALQGVADAAAAIKQGAERLAHADFQRLSHSIAATAGWLKENPKRHSESIAMEVATAILLIGNALDNFGHLGADFKHQVDVMVARLQGCVSGKPPTADSEIPVLDEMTRRAQEKLLIGQVVREIQSSLGQIEQALDTFFREPEQKEQLAACSKPLKQIAGALAILGQMEAVTALNATEKKIARFSAAGYQPNETDFESVARQLSALGFFVETLQSGNISYPEFVRTLEVRPSKVEAAKAAGAPQPPASSPDATGPISEPTSLVASEPMAAPVLAVTDDTPDSAAPAAAPAVAESPISVQSPPPAALAPSAPEVDAELLEIFLEEANEVLGSVGEQLEHLRGRPSDSDALTTVRRAFHTLKGSSRMVGLSAFGEVAWVVEQVHNLWLRQEKPVDGQLLQLIEMAGAVFSAWVAHLEGKTPELPDPAALIAFSEKLKGHETVAAPGKATATPASPAPDVPHEISIDIDLPNASAEIAVTASGAACELTLDAPAPVELAFDEPAATEPDGEEAGLADAVPMPELELLAIEPSGADEEFDGPETAKVELALVETDVQEITLSLEPTSEAADATSSAEVMPEKTEIPAVLELAAESEESALQINFGGDEAGTVASEEPGEHDLVLPELAEAPLETAIVESPTVDTAASNADSACEAESIGLAETFQAVELAEPLDAIEMVELVASPEDAEDAGEAAEESQPDLNDTPEVAPRLAQKLTVSPVLFQIFLEEAQVHVATLQRCFGELEVESAAPTPAEMVRAAHTLGSISGTVGFQNALQLGHGLEAALLRREKSAKPASLEALETLRIVIAELDQMVGAIGRGEPSGEAAALVANLAELYPLASIQELAAAESKLRVADEKAAAAREEPLPPEDDQIDHSLLPIFLEEADDLINGVNERLGMWQADPFDSDSMHALTRLLHTLKGSARMAGAMRVGALTHRLEGRVEEAYRAGGADPTLVAGLQAGFDEIAEQIEALRGPKIEGLDLTGGSSVADEFVILAAELPGDSVASLEVPSVSLAELSVEPAAQLNIAAPITFASPFTAEDDASVMPVEELIASSESPSPISAVPADQLDPDLLPIFLEEAVEIVRNVYEQLDAWQQAPDDGEASHALARSLHTLKGSARMAGAMSVGALTHTLESQAEEASKTGHVYPELIEEMKNAFDAIAHIVERLQQGESLTDMTIAIDPPTSAGLPAGAAPAPAPAQTSTDFAASLMHDPVADVAPAMATAAPTAPAQPAVKKDADAAKPMLRVRAELVDTLVNDAGELSIARARIEGEMRSLKQSLLDLTENVIRLRRQLREIEIQAESQMQSHVAVTQDVAAGFDPLELDRFTRFQEVTRMMSESVNDVATVQQSLLKNLDEANAALAAQARLNRELQQELMSVRMVPFTGVTERLYRIVRQTAKEIGKRVDLEIAGAQIELDQNVINKMVAPFEHLLRNAIAHGIETPSLRIEHGKAETGEIRLTLRQEGNEVIIAMQDDGAGLNLSKIREKAIAKGLLRPDEEADQRRLSEMIFQSGFSTATEVSQIAGRGVGMDVVMTEITNLGGRMEVASEIGKGCTFRIYLPLTLAVTNAVLVRAGTRVFAIPATMIDQVQEVRETALGQIRESGEIAWLGNRYPFHYLPKLLGEPDALPEARKMYWLILLHSGLQRIAIQVDELQGTHEIVVKNIGPQLARVVGIAGATVLGDGNVVLILNPVALASRFTVSSAAASATEAVPAAPVVEEKVVHLPTVLVVDDSLTVRKITGRLLAREGYQVMTAKDGVDALEQMTEIIPDVILSDIEMPRMDGFELARNIRDDERLRDIPIVMISSRTADKHRSHAAELGVSHFLGKPYQEEELLDLVGGFIAEQRAAA
jgi:chemosensory pili system protein ChpA (sensor histidine kinase/response regulator)